MKPNIRRSVLCPVREVAHERTISRTGSGVGTGRSPDDRTRPVGAASRGAVPPLAPAWQRSSVWCPPGSVPSVWRLAGSVPGVSHRAGGIPGRGNSRQPPPSSRLQAFFMAGGYLQYKERGYPLCPRSKGSAGATRSKGVRGLLEFEGYCYHMELPSYAPSIPDSVPGLPSNVACAGLRGRESLPCRTDEIDGKPRAVRARRRRRVWAVVVLLN